MSFNLRSKERPSLALSLRSNRISVGEKESPKDDANSLSGKKEVSAPTKGRRNSLPIVEPRVRRVRGSIRNTSLDSGRRAAPIESQTPNEGRKRRTRELESPMLSGPEVREAKKLRAANVENVEQEQAPKQNTSGAQRKFGITLRARRSERTTAKTPNGSYNDGNGSDSGISVSNSSVVPSKASSESGLPDSSDVSRSQPTRLAPGTFEPENDGDVEYEVEAILDFWRDARGSGFLIKWMGYTDEYNTWEPARNIEECEDKIIAFLQEREQQLVNAVKPAENMSRALKNWIKKCPMPNDPRPFHERTKLIFSLTSEVSDEELLEAYKQLKTMHQQRHWSVEKVNQFLLNIMLGNQSLGNPLVARKHFLYAQAESLRELQQVNLKKWEGELNETAQGRPQIIVENNADLVGPPKDFTFINDYVPGNGVEIPNDPLIGCNCKASCWKSKACCPSMSHCDFAYNKNKRLKIGQGEAIYECNKRCNCDETCSNRVVQDGWTTLGDMRMCIFRTVNNCGWGVKTLKPIKKGTFVTLYAGEIITTEEAETRGKEYDRLGQTYLFDLDFARQDCPYVVDAARMGNISHFINHSCEPNMAVFNLWFNCLDPDMPKLALFTIRDVAKNEELTFDYVTNEPQKNAKKDKEFSSRSGARYPCLCGTPSCRKLLF